MSEQNQHPAPFDYTAACAAATTDQGLDPVVAALRAARYDVTVEQTGGFTMVATVTTPDGVIGISDDTPAGAMAPQYLVCAYPGDTWNEGEPESQVATAHGLGDMVTAVANLHAALTEGS